MQVFDPIAFDLLITGVAEHYEKSAPTVETWCDWLRNAKDDEIRLSDLQLLATLAEKVLTGPAAANAVYHHEYRLGRDTTGQLGF